MSDFLYAFHEDEEWWSETDPLSRERPCMSDLSPYVQKNFHKIEEW